MRRDIPDLALAIRGVWGTGGGMGHTGAQGGGRRGRGAGAGGEGQGEGAAGEAHSPHVRSEIRPSRQQSAGVCVLVPCIVPGARRVGISGP